jgi:hypothetical protein
VLIYRHPPYNSSVRTTDDNQFLIKLRSDAKWPAPPPQTQRRASSGGGGGGGTARVFSGDGEVVEILTPAQSPIGEVLRAINTRCEPLGVRAVGFSDGKRTVVGASVDGGSIARFSDLFHHRPPLRLQLQALPATALPSSAASLPTFLVPINGGAVLRDGKGTGLGVVERFLRGQTFLPPLVVFVGLATGTMFVYYLFNLGEHLQQEEARMRGYNPTEEYLQLKERDRIARARADLANGVLR